MDDLDELCSKQATIDVESEFFKEDEELAFVLRYQAVIVCIAGPF